MMGRATSGKAIISIPRTATNIPRKGSLNFWRRPVLGRYPAGRTIRVHFWCVMLKLSDQLPRPAAADISISEFFNTVRAHSVALAAPLSAEDCAAQSMPDASPVKWHLAHTTWFFETFILEQFETGFKPFNPVFRMLFNSYYNGIGERYTRAQRGMLTRPSLAEVV